MKCVIFAILQSFLLLSVANAEPQSFPRSYSWELQAGESSKSPEAIAWDRFAQDNFIRPFDLSWKQAADLTKKCFILQNTSSDNGKLNATFDVVPIGNRAFTLEDGIWCQRMDIVQAHLDSFKAKTDNEQFNVAWRAALHSPETFEAMLQAKFFDPDWIPEGHDNPLICIAIPNVAFEGFKILIKHGASRKTICSAKNWGWSENDIGLLALAKDNREQYNRDERPIQQAKVKELDEMIKILASQ